MDFITSDHHFYHKNIIKYCKRPFSSVEEMNETMIDAWNKKVPSNANIYHLGDFCLARRETNRKESIKNLLSRLNGKITLICGSHDRDSFANKDLFHRVYQRNTIVEINYKGIPIIMGHCPMLSWEKRFHGSIHFFGHSHTRPDNNFKCSKGSYDVGVDNNEFTPLTIDEAIEKARNHTNILDESF